MNTYIFFLHLFLVLSFTWYAFKLTNKWNTTLPLMICASTQVLLANLFVLKQIQLFGGVVTCSDAYAIGTLLAINLLQAQYGKNEAQRAAFLCIGLMGFFVVFSQIQLLYSPAVEDKAHAHYAFILSQSPRLVFASLAAFFVGQFLDRKVFTRLTNIRRTNAFAIRNLISIVCSQFTDTALFTIIGLAGVLSPLWDIFLISFLAKTIAIFALTPIIHALSFISQMKYDVKQLVDKNAL